LIHAATVSARKECKRDVAFVLKETLKTPDNTRKTYNEVIEAKLQCRPEGIEVMENTAQVLLQNLLDHTAQILIKLQSDDFKQFPDIFTIKLICRYGFDGTTGHNAYKLKFETEALGTPISDQS